MVNGITYEARVAAVGPGGSTLSAISNQFTFPTATPAAGAGAACAVCLYHRDDQQIGWRGIDDGNALA